MTFQIKFHGNPKTYDIPEHTDEAIDNARDIADSDMGGKGPGQRALVNDPRTGFPSFVVFEDNEEIAGG